MLFNSYAFICVFLPIIVIGFYFCEKKLNVRAAKIWLFIGSLTFYSYWNINYLSLILASIIVNYFIVRKLGENQAYRKIYFYLGIGFNLFLLGFFKYFDFFLLNTNYVFETDFQYLKLLLPLGISFFTLQQLAFIVDTYQGFSKKGTFLDYALFVSFFPQLIAGPIVHHSDLIPQFEKRENQFFNSKNFSIGIYIFTLGLAKKVLIADTFADFANTGFQSEEPLHLFMAWGTSLSYTFQLYFDFSGYSDMAIGLGYFFNIKLPVNFNSPLKSKNIIEFWTRWHITLSEFITTYVFTPIVRSMPKLTFNNMILSSFIAMALSGLWHGAGWTFIIYGLMHGVAIAINHYWKKRKTKLPTWLACFLSFNFINISFTMFRAESLDKAIDVYHGMLGGYGVTFPKGILPKQVILDAGMKITHHMTNNENLNLLMLIVGIIVVFKAKNTMTLLREFKPTTKLAFSTAFIFVLCMFGVNSLTEFIYFNF